MNLQREKDDGNNCFLFCRSHQDAGYNILSTKGAVGILDQVGLNRDHDTPIKPKNLAHRSKASMTVTNNLYDDDYQIDHQIQDEEIYDDQEEEVDEPASYITSPSKCRKR